MATDFILDRPELVLWANTIHKARSGSTNSIWKLGDNCYYNPDDVPNKKDIAPLATQVQGNHYKKLGIQPVEYAHANNLDYFQGSVVKYVTRWRDKGGIHDLEKAIHFLQIYIELETKK